MGQMAMEGPDQWTGFIDNPRTWSSSFSVPNQLHISQDHWATNGAAIRGMMWAIWVSDTVYPMENAQCFVVFCFVGFMLLYYNQYWLTNILQSDLFGPRAVILVM